MGDGELGIATKKSQTPGKQEAPRTMVMKFTQNIQQKGDRTCGQTDYDHKEN